MGFRVGVILLAGWVWWPVLTRWAICSHSSLKEPQIGQITSCGPDCTAVVTQLLILPAVGASIWACVHIRVYTPV